MGPFPLSKKGHRFILVVADCFTKFVFVVPLRSATSSALQENVECIFLAVGAPALMICDNGKQYVGKAFRRLVESYDCEITFNPNYHPQANPTERINRVVKTAIRSYLDNHSHRDWDLIRLCMKSQGLVQRILLLVERYTRPENCIRGSNPFRLTPRSLSDLEMRSTSICKT
jgi:transposase InsO family protein